MLHFEIIENGKTLRVTANNPAEFAEWIKEHEDDCVTSYTPNSDMAFMELSESYTCNGWTIVTADQLGQMSECLIICEDATLEDDGSYTLNGRCWSNFEDYQIVSPLYMILEHEHADFPLLWEATPERKSCKFCGDSFFAKLTEAWTEDYCCGECEALDECSEEDENQ